MNAGRAPVRRPVSSSTPRASLSPSSRPPGGNKQARSCTHARYHPHGAWCTHREEEGGEVRRPRRRRRRRRRGRGGERNETKGKNERNERGASCRVNTLVRVHMRAVLEGQPRSNEETKREIVGPGWEKRGVFSGKRITGVSMVFV